MLDRRRRDALPRARLYRGLARGLSLAILRLYGIRIRVHRAEPLPRTQTVFVSNHTSTLDLFVLVALGLPNMPVLPERVPAESWFRSASSAGCSARSSPFRRIARMSASQIFKRAERVLRRTGESVYLSPEGGRVTTGEIGRFNKGAFHLATNLQAPIVPFYIRIPAGGRPAARLRRAARNGRRLFSAGHRHARLGAGRSAPRTSRTSGTS